MEIAKIENGQVFIHNVDGAEVPQGFKTFVRAEVPSYDTETQMLEVSYKETKTEIRERWKVCRNDNKINSTIVDIKSKLSSTDYMIIKSYEAKLTMTTAPYSNDELEQMIRQRQQWRDEINRLEQILNT